MRSTLGILAAVLLFGCGEDEPEQLSALVPCDEDRPCQSGYSCLDNECIEQHVVPVGGACTEHEQCEEGLICLAGACFAACFDLYYQSDCDPDTWCKPFEGAFLDTAEGERLQIGRCSPSECDPELTEVCVDGRACMKVAPNVGACMDACDYDFLTANSYSDNCVNTADQVYGCQPLGMNNVPLCLPAASPLTGPTVGTPGCDAIWSPCRPQDICVGHVCRQICTNAQLEPCNAGETCTAIGERNDIYYCVARN